MRYMLFGLIVAASVACIYLMLISPPNPGSIDEAGVKRIKALCGSRTDCEVTLRDIFPGDWDWFYQFGYDASQSEVSETLHTRTIFVSDLQNIYAFTKDRRVTKRGYGDTGQGQPLAGEIEFSGNFDPKHPNWQAYPSGARFKVKSCPTLEGGKLFGPYGGISYLFVVTPVRADYVTACQVPSG